MTEEIIFVAALEKSTPAERVAYLEEVCAGDAAMRQRVEALLQSHFHGGSFLETPAVQCAVEELGQPCSADTEGEPAGSRPEGDPLDFLAASDKPGSMGRLSHYEVQEVIGRGGMGIVLKAFDEKLHRVVAIKVMAAQMATNATARKRFAREAQAAAAVSHDHIVTIHAVEEANPLPYLVMQYVAGLSLQQRLDRDGPLELQEILRIGMQTASALDAAHAQGLIHRDIKPANILLENGVERVKVTDFGLARAFADASLTQEGVVAGTPQYMAPEQARGEPVDQRSDLFSLGSVLYAMCTGRAPFRASGSMAVLKRVCEETPSPIREANSQIPDWLIAIIDKLHAKDAADRFQSAAEVADLLGRHLAHVQHPSVAPLPAAPRPVSPLGGGAGGEGRSPPRRLKWAMAAAALLMCLLGGLGLTEATGVTNLRGTVIRIFTPDGTLVVETDDPAVKVTVEGDGDLVITGAGAQEVRLRPGSYKLHAVKDGKPVTLDRDLVTITRGDKQIVRVRLEGESAASIVSKPERGAFVVLAGKGIAERKFDTLAEAVLTASDGDTVEVHGNGPFITKPIDLGKRALTIRAATGFRPVIQAIQQPASVCFAARASLVLEGLDFWLLPPPPGNNDLHVPFLVAGGGSLHVANCRFRSDGIRRHHVCLAVLLPSCTIRNCQFASSASVAVAVDFPACKRLVVDNCVYAGAGMIAIQPNYREPKEDVEIRLTRSTLACTLYLWASGGLKDAAAKPIRLEASGNIFDEAWILRADLSNLDLGQPPEAQAQATVRRMLEWRGRQNLYAPRACGVHSTNPGLPISVQSLAGWKKFWNDSDADAREGAVRYQGGELAIRFAPAPEALSAEDFRLRPESAGYRAGKDGKDLGADVDLVGPGPAYERWKKTPEYQQWLRDTGQKK